MIFNYIYIYMYITINNWKEISEARLEARGKSEAKRQALLNVGLLPKRMNETCVATDFHASNQFYF